jgi:hypothetical protein
MTRIIKINEVRPGGRRLVEGAVGARLVDHLVHGHHILA